MAASYHRRRCNRGRAARAASASTQATSPQFLYRDYQGECDVEPSSIPHLIVKKTKKLVFVEQDRYHPDPWDRPTYALDRARLEAEGSVWARSARDIFYTTPYEQRRRPWVSPDLAVLGLKRGASQEDIKAAYRRLARQHHPVCGGDPERFKEVQAAYERATAG